MRPVDPALSAIRALAADEFRTAFRGSLIPGTAALFGLIALGISLAGLGASGSVVLQGYARTSVSILGLALYVVPLLGLLAGSTALSRSRGEMELLLAQPVDRREILVGRWLGLAAALAVGIGAGFAVPGIAVAVIAGGGGIIAYLLVVFCSLYLCVVALGAGTLVGVGAPGRGAAAARAVGVWLAAVVLYDLGAIGLLQILGDGQPGPALLGLLVLNPIDAVRTVVLSVLGAETLLGPSGMALRRMLTGPGAVALLGCAFVGWLVIPAAAAFRRFMRHDY